MSIGSRLVELRTQKGLTRVQMAEELHIPMTTLRNYEIDTREPGHKFLIEASKYFNVSIDYILENEKAPAPEEAEADGYEAILAGLANMLQRMGWVREDGDITLEDKRFLLAVAAMLNSYFEEHR